MFASPTEVVVVENMASTSTDPRDYSGQVTVVDIADFLAYYNAVEAWFSVAGVKIQRFGGIVDCCSVGAI